MTEIYAFGTFSNDGGQEWPGVCLNGEVLPLKDLIEDAPGSLAVMLGAWGGWEERVHRAMQFPPVAGWVAEQALSIHLPYRPDSIFGSGANYRKHVIDLIVDHGAGGVAHLDTEARRKHGVELMDRRAATGKPYVFLVPRSAVGGSHEPLVLPYDMEQPDWELELAVVIGKTTRRVSRKDALGHVAGYTIVNDITARELVDRPDIPQMGMDWLASKSAMGFKVTGPYITPARFVPDPQKLHIRLSLNGEVRQDEGTDDMIFSVARLIEFISAYVQLNPGDLIMTGSPSGNGTHYNRFLRDGDVMKGEILGLAGAQMTPCRLEAQSPIGTGA